MMVGVLGSEHTNPVRSRGATPDPPTSYAATSDAARNGLRRPEAAA